MVVQCPNLDCLLLLLLLVPCVPPPSPLVRPLVLLCVLPAARYMMWVLQDIPEMNALGVERMIRGLALLQVRGRREGECSCCVCQLVCWSVCLLVNGC